MYFTLLTLSDFIATDTEIWNRIHCWVTNSTVGDLLSRLLTFGSDVVTVGEIFQHSPDRAREIASSRSTLSTLIGANVHLLPDEPINGTLFLHQQQTMVPRWRRVALAFQKMNYNLMKLKYAPSRTHDPNYLRDPNAEHVEFDSTAKRISEAGAVLKLGGHELQRRFMAMPTLAILQPVFR